MVEKEGISHKMVNRVPLLRGYIVGHGVEIKWATRGNCSNLLEGGVIFIQLASGFYSDGVPEHDYVHHGCSYLASCIEAIPAGDRLPPLLGATTVLSAIATINAFSLAAGDNQHFTHIARTNHNTKPIYERLLRSGIYYYSNLRGDPVPGPIETYAGILFACRLPNVQIHDLLGRFSIPEAVEELEHQYEAIKTRYPSLTTLDQSSLSLFKRP